MSRSRRKTPICGNTTAESEKKDKTLSQRALRRRINQQIPLMHEDDVVPTMKEVRNASCMDKDGKHRFNPSQFPALMRK
jgi:hypothetical protein